MQVQWATGYDRTGGQDDAAYAAALWDQILAMPTRSAATTRSSTYAAMYVAAKAREVGNHPDIDIRWQRIRFGITTHDAGHRIMELDFAMARHIDGIAAGHGAKPVPPGDA